MNIVFDLDGTLIDSAQDICLIVNSILGDLEREALSLDVVRSFIGEGAAVLISRVMAARGLSESSGLHEKLLVQFISRYETMAVESPFYPGVSVALDELRGSGHCLGLCTNKPEGPTRAVMRQSGLDKILDAMIAGGMVDSRKPEPDMLQHVVKEMGGAPALYVGDSETDAETARRAGIPFALFSGGYRKSPVDDIHHDWVFDHFDELNGIVERASS